MFTNEEVQIKCDYDSERRDHLLVGKGRRVEWLNPSTSESEGGFEPERCHLGAYVT